MEIKVEGNVFTITCLLGSGVPSKSGKTDVVCTTGGFIPVADSNLKVSLNVIKPRRS